MVDARADLKAVTGLNLDLDCVEAFVVLAAEGHFGRSARSLNLSPSALSKRIRRLETSIGARLIERDTGGFSVLTGVGSRFLEHCEPLLRVAREARRDALLGGNPSVVRLGVPGSPIDHFPLSAWRLVALALRQLVPRCRLELCDVPYGYVEQSLLEGHVDLLLSVGTFDHPDLKPCQFAAAGRVLLVSRRHELAGAGTTTVAGVANLPLIREPTAPSHCMAPWLLGDLIEPRDVRVVDVPARTLGDVKHAVQIGTATTVASASLIPLIPPGIAVLPILDAPSVPLFAVRRHHDERDEVLALMQTIRVLAAALVMQPPHAAPIPKPSRRAPAWTAWTVGNDNYRTPKGT